MAGGSESFEPATADGPKVDPGKDVGALAVEFRCVRPCGTKKERSFEL